MYDPIEERMARDPSGHRDRRDLRNLLISAEILAECGDSQIFDAVRDSGIRPREIIKIYEQAVTEAGERWLEDRWELERGQ